MTRTIQNTLLSAALAVAIFSGTAAAQSKAPKSVIHVVTLYWKDGVTDAQKKEVFDGVHKMAAEIKGIRHVWTRSVKVQGEIEGKPVANAFVMEFENEAALLEYAKHPAHAAWEKIYHPLRGESRTHDITN